METTSPKLFDMLNESPRALTLRTIHRDFFLELAEAAAIELHGPDQAAWLDAVQAEHENLRTAIEWSLGQEDETALRFVGALWEFWEVRGFSTEGLEWARRALATGDQAPTSARARAHLGAGRFTSLSLGSSAEAIELVNQGLADARASGDRKTASHALRILAQLHFGLDGPAASQPLLDESLQLANETNSDHEIAGALRYLGRFGDPTERRKCLEQAMEIYRRVGDKRGLALTLPPSGDEDIDSVRARAEEVLEIARELKDDTLLGSAFQGLAVVEQYSGQYEHALSLHEEILETLRPRGQKHGSAPTSVDSLG